MKQSDQEIVAKMIKYCDDIISMKNRFGDSLESFQADYAYQYAVGMCILQIGELVGRLSDETIIANVQIPWREIRAMRNIYAHNYERTKPLTIWQTISSDVPELKKQLQMLLDDVPADDMAKKEGEREINSTLR